MIVLLLRLLSSEHSVLPSKGPMVFPASAEPNPRPETAFWHWVAGANVSVSGGKCWVQNFTEFRQF